MEIPKFKIGDKVVQQISAKNPYHNPMEIVGVITSVTYLSGQWSYVIRAEKGYAVTNEGKVLNEWAYENHNTTANESELEKVG
jgi:hypothetical protein